MRPRIRDQRQKEMMEAAVAGGRRHKRGKDEACGSYSPKLILY